MNEIQTSYERKASYKQSYLPTRAFIINLWKSAFIESFQRQIGFSNALRRIQQQNRNSFSKNVNPN